MNRIDIMVDLETLGKSAETPLIQFSAIAFDITNGRVLDRFDNKIRLDGHILVDADTLKWWLKTNVELLNQIIAEGVFTEQETLENFKTFVEYQTFTESLKLKNVYLWGNGILFDNTIIKGKMLKYDMVYPIFYRNDRDVRTFAEAACLITGDTYENMREEAHKNFLEHDALQDCLAQIELICRAYQIIKPTT